VKEDALVPFTIALDAEPVSTHEFDGCCAQAMNAPMNTMQPGRRTCFMENVASTTIASAITTKCLLSG
jgi:hypothetical protein